MLVLISKGEIFCLSFPFRRKPEIPCLPQGPLCGRNISPHRDKGLHELLFGKKSLRNLTNH